MVRNLPDRAPRASHFGLVKGVHLAQQPKLHKLAHVEGFNGLGGRVLAAAVHGRERLKGAGDRRVPTGVAILKLLAFAVL